MVSAIACSAAATACRKLPGGSSTMAAPKRTTGARDWNAISPPTVTRAKSAAAAIWPTRIRASADRDPLLRSTPLTSTSIPVSVRVTWRMGADLGCCSRGAASLRRSGRAATSRGSAMTQVSIGARVQA